MGTPVRAAVGGLRALGPRASIFADFLSCNSKVWGLFTVIYCMYLDAVVRETFFFISGLESYTVEQDTVCS